ncbi:MAG: hypothetical protein ACRC67_14880, partial [Inquilinus sp.]|uniref:hypothetical protein n=1 Tax=Inquilinus sp. TaxID=1932117 RepID=UPI003F362965
MTDTPILPPITFQQGKYWFRFKTVTEAVDGMGRMLQVIDDASPEAQRLLSCHSILRKYDDASASNLPDHERAQLEHFSSFVNRMGFPKAANSDSRYGLVREASLHDATSFHGYPGPGG